MSHDVQSTEYHDCFTWGDTVVTFDLNQSVTSQRQIN